MDEVILTPKEKEAFDAYHDMMDKEQKEYAVFFDRVMAPLKRRLTEQQYSELMEFMKEDCCHTVKGIVRKHKVFGEEQEEGYWFKKIYLTQHTGYVCDSYHGTIFVPIDDVHYLHLEFSM